MTEKTKSPGRPKTQAAVAEAPVKKKRTIKRNEQILQHAEYEIPKNAGIVYMLPQKGITVYDKENDTVREMRYCPNEPASGLTSRATTP